MAHFQVILLSLLCTPFLAIGQCPPGEDAVYINIIPDNYPEDLSWKLFVDNLLAGSGTFNSDTICAESDACIRFEIYDSYGDGLCCGSGLGSYSVTFLGETIGSGAVFTTDSTHEYNCLPDTLEIMSALQAMIGHVNNSSPLSLAEREQFFHEIIWDYTEIFSLIEQDIYTYIVAYQASYPPIFENRNQVDISQLAPETKLLIDFQQYILDTQVNSGNAAALEGVIFEFSTVYPGPVAPNAPRIANAVVPVNGTHIHLPAAITAYDQDPAKRPTGYYAPPGELVTITIPASMTGAGLVAQIGVHIDDLSHRTHSVNRLVRITNDFPLDQVSTTIISPLGGGIYIKVPEPSDLGWFDITIDQAVKSPYFSLRTGYETNPADWQSDLANHYVEWVDLESDKYMMTLPLSHVQDLADPTSLMTQWNDIMDAYNYMGGRPPEARSKAEYFAVDCLLPVGAFGIGYPQIIGDGLAPFGPLNATPYYPTRVLLPDPHLSGLSTTFHELGHAAAHPKMDHERETLVNIYAVYIFNVLYGVPLDDAFMYSEFQLMTLDQAAIDWMVTHNFRANVDMSCDPILPPDICDELRYQHRGHAKYVEMAKQFGWYTFHEMNKVFYEQDLINPGVWDDIFKESDEIIAAASHANGINMSPLFHFWGLAPSPQLAEELAADYGFPDQLCEMLTYYKTVVPLTGTDLAAYYNNLYQQDWTMDDRYSIYVTEYESENYYDAIQAQIDFLIDTYGPCTPSDAAEQAGLDLRLYPNPTTGEVNLHFNSETDLSIQATDVYGRIVFQQQQISGPDFGFVLNGAPGVYIIQVEAGGAKTVFKVVKRD